jgi:MFS family permease
MMLSFPLVKYVLVAALRDRLMIAMTIVLVVGASLAMFLGGSAVFEQSLFTLVFAGAALRILVVLGLVLFVVFFVRRAFDSKEIEYLLSRPVGRMSLILSFAFAFSVLCLFMGIAVGACVCAVSPHLIGYSHILWVVSIIVEMVIMANTALFFSMYISSASSATMVTLGVYVLGRLMGQLLGIVDSEIIENQGVYAMAMQMVSVITPRLDLLGQSSWLIYGMNDDYNLVYALCQGVFFSALVLLAASFDFIRREF